MIAGQQPQAEKENDCGKTTFKHHPKEGDRLQNKENNGKSKAGKSKSKPNGQTTAASQAANLFGINAPPSLTGDIPDAEKNDLSAEKLGEGSTCQRKKAIGKATKLTENALKKQEIECRDLTAQNVKLKEYAAELE